MAVSELELVPSSASKGVHGRQHAPSVGAAQPVALLLLPSLLLVLGWYVFAPATTQTEPDYWWHVRTGQLIVETGQLPRTDPYSHTVAGQPWVTHEWLTEVLLFVLQRQVGYLGNVTLFGLVGVLTALAVYAACRLRGLGEPAAALLMLVGTAVTVVLTNVRAQGLTMLLLGLTALLLTWYKRGQRRALWPLPALLALWVNLHGGYVIGLALLGLALFGETLARVVGRPSAPLRPLLAVLACSTVATLLSPHGLEGLRYPFQYLGSENASMRYIAEWQSPDFHQLKQPHVLMLAASLLLGLGLGLGWRPLGPTEVLWALLLTLLALQSVRHIALFAVVVIPLLGARLQAELPALRRPVGTWRRPILLGVVLWSLLLLVLVRIGPSVAEAAHLQPGAEPNALTYPAGAVEYLRTHQPPGKLFNSYDWGGYLLYQLYPDRQVFIDGRADVYGDQVVERYLDVVLLRPGWRQVLAEHEIRLVLVGRDSPLAVVLAGDPRWRELYAGAVERLFERQAR